MWNVFRWTILVAVIFTFLFLELFETSADAAQRRRNNRRRPNIQNLPKPVLVYKDFQVRIADDVKVRAMQPLETYDEKGNIKKYTSEELRELKGSDARLPGYAASFNELGSGHVVRVYLTMEKPGPNGTTTKVSAGTAEGIIANITTGSLTLRMQGVGLQLALPSPTPWVSRNGPTLLAAYPFQ
ncbi:MAG: hypothetical protein ACK4RK_11680, partial [Gemmataceae bacterium]